MLTFPDDFLDSDGRFRAYVTPEPVPVIYVTAGGSYICADCLNTLRPVLDDPEQHNGTWTPITFELLPYGPEICCEHCSRAVAPLYGQDESF